VKQAILYGARDLRIEDTPFDCANLQSDQLYAETVVSALSTGTDLGNYLGDSTYVPGAPDYPRRIGYSNVAVVRQVGTDVSHPKIGQRVFSTQPHLSAYVARQSDILVTVPESVSSEQASLAYLTHLGLAALRQANYLPGENVAIVGLGIIGLCTAGLARAMGAKVAGIANSSGRADAAVRAGAHAALLAYDPESGARDRSIDRRDNATVVPKSEPKTSACLVNAKRPVMLPRVVFVRGSQPGFVASLR